MTTPAHFEMIWAKARQAANAAAKAENDRLGPETRRGLDCGFAWINFPGTTPFARWTKKQGISEKHWSSGRYIWYGKLHDIPTQSISVHMAAARAARDVIAQMLGTTEIYTGSRLD